MPFKSKAQMKFMFAKHPKIAVEFAKHTSDFKDLPQRVANKKFGKYHTTRGKMK